MAAEDRQKMSVLITCRDLERTVDFYVNKLGFTLKERWPETGPVQWGNLVLDGQSIMCGGMPEASQVERMCANDEELKAHWLDAADKWARNAPGVGMQVYLQVPDVDAFQERLQEHGVPIQIRAKDQFYGIREMHLVDPDGYHLVPFHVIQLTACQSCAMPMAGAEPGQMYCQHCTNDAGHLRTYEEVFEGTVTGYFMGQQKLPRADAERAAKDHLAKQPAWANRS